MSDSNAELLAMLSDMMKMVGDVVQRTSVQEEIVIGTPGKGGSITVKVNWGNEDEAHNRIAAALRQRMQAAEQLKLDDSSTSGG